MAAKRMALWAALGALVVVSASMVVAGASAALGPANATAPAHAGESNNSTATNYTVTFTETGLPSGTGWSVVVSITSWWFQDGGHAFNSSNTSTLTFSLPNGTYHFRVFPANGNESTPDRGTFTVNGTAPPPIAVHFGAPTLYTVTFAESGLASGTEWGVFLFATNGSQACWGWWHRCDGPGNYGGGQGPPPGPGGAGHHHGGGGGWGIYFNRTNGTSLTFRVPNGTYNYSVLEVFGYSVVGAASGSVNVSGASPAPIAVTFSVLPVYSVTFVESGLPTGTNWSVEVFGHGGVGARHGNDPARHEGRRGAYGTTSSTSTISLNLTNGTYRYRVGFVDGYYANDSRGAFTVAGASPPEITINFTAIPTWNVTFDEHGLPAGTDWGVAITGHAAHVTGSPSRHVVVSAASRGSVTVSLPRGHYRFSALKLSGWEATRGPHGDRFAVAGSSHVTTVLFTPSHASRDGTRAVRSGALPAATASASGVGALIATARAAFAGALPV